MSVPFRPVIVRGRAEPKPVCVVFKSDRHLRRAVDEMSRLGCRPTEIQIFKCRAPDEANFAGEVPAGAVAGAITGLILGIPLALVLGVDRPAWLEGAGILCIAAAAFGAAAGRWIMRLPEELGNELAGHSAIVRFRARDQDCARDAHRILLRHGGIPAAPGIAGDEGAREAA